MTPSLRARLSRYAPAVRRAHEQYSTGAKTQAAMSALRAGPPTYAPPAHVSWRTELVEGVSPDGWPVFEVGPVDGRSVARVVFLHGGAYFRELRAPHWRLAAYLARVARLTILVPIYPLAPEGVASSVVPMMTELARDVIRFPGPVFLVGDSAGAGMALAVAAELPVGSLEGLVLVSPWVDVLCTDPGLAARADLDPWLQVPGLRQAGDAYRGGLPADHPWVSPIHGPLRGPMLVMSGTDDILNADAHRLVDAARSAGETVDFVEAPGMIHGYPLHPTPEGRAARGQIAAWVRARLAETQNG